MFNSIPFIVMDVTKTRLFKKCSGYIFISGVKFEKCNFCPFSRFIFKLVKFLFKIPSTITPSCYFLISKGTLVARIGHFDKQSVIIHKIFRSEIVIKYT